MAENSEDTVEFRLGFASDPDARERLESLAQAVEKAQERMTASVKSFADSAQASVQAVLGQVEAASQKSNRTVAASRGAGPGQDAEREFKLIDDISRAIAHRIGLEQDLARVVAARATRETESATQRLAAELRLLDVLENRRQIEEKSRSAGGKSYEDAAKAARQLTAAERERATVAAEATVAFEQSAEKQKEAAREKDAALTREKQQTEELTETIKRKAATAQDAYIREIEASQKVRTEMRRASTNFTQNVERTGRGMGLLVRSAVFLGIAQKGVNEELMQTLAGVQSGIDAVTGTERIFRGARGAIDGLRAVIVAKAAAEQAAARVSAASTAATAANAKALDAEAAAAGRATFALNARNVALNAGQGAAIRSTGTTVATTAVGGVAANMGAGALAAGTIKLLAGAAVPAAIALGAIAVAAAEFRNATNGMTEAQRRAAKTPEEMGTVRDIFLSLGTALSANLQIATVPLKGSFRDLVGANQEFLASVIFGAERLLNWTGAIDTFGDAATKAAEERSREFRAQQQHLQRLRAIEIRGAQEREEIASRGQAEIFDRDLNRAESPQERVEMIQDRLGEIGQTFDEAMKRFESLRGLDGVAIIGDSAAEAAEAEAAFRQVNAAMEEQISLLNRKEQALLETRREEEQAAAAAQRAQAEELKGLLDIIDARERDMELAKAGRQSAEQRFGAMGDRDQQKVVEAIKKAREGDLEALSNRQIDLLNRLGTKEAQGFVEEINRRRAQAGGFDRFDLDRGERLAEEAARRAREEAAREFADRTGVAQEDLDTDEQRQKLRVDINDLTTIEIKMSEQTEKLLEMVDQAIRDAMAERIRLLQEQEQARQDANAANERMEHQNRIAAERNAD